MEKIKYCIDLIGCDDDTPFIMELTKEEAELIEKVAKKSKEVSSYGCMPTMEVKPLSECGEWGIYLMERERGDSY